MARLAAQGTAQLAALRPTPWKTAGAQALDFHLRSESANADETVTLNASLSKAQDQVR